MRLRSAKAGRSYKHTEGELVFEPGLFRQSIEIETVGNPLWSPTLEYKVQLYDPEGCTLGLYLQTARVKVIDRNPFPTSKYADQASAQGLSESGFVILRAGPQLACPSACSR